jgi:xanthine dehydrogenase YagT iron-sulfur-binding subunit
MPRTKGASKSPILLIRRGGPEEVAVAETTKRSMSSSDPTPQENPWTGISRRSALKRGLLLGGAFLVKPARGTSDPAGGEISARAGEPSKKLPISFMLNGKPEQRTIEARTTLLDLLRDDLAKTGTKKGCDHGQCGACTIHVDDRRVLSCLTLAVTVDGKSITTIEGLGSGEHLHPLQSAFIEHDAFQCGFCTPGQLMSASAFLKEPWPESTDGIREGMSGNICRCGAYCGIVAAIKQVRSSAPAQPA